MIKRKQPHKNNGNNDDNNNIIIIRRVRRVQRRTLANQKMVVGGDGEGLDVVPFLGIHFQLCFSFIFLDRKIESNEGKEILSEKQSKGVKATLEEYTQRL